MFIIPHLAAQVCCAVHRFGNSILCGACCLFGVAHIYGSFGEAQIEVGCATHSWSSQCTDVPTHSQLDLTPRFGLISVADAGPTQPGETAGDYIPDLREIVGSIHGGQYSWKIRVRFKDACSKARARGAAAVTDSLTVRNTGVGSMRAITGWRYAADRAPRVLDAMCPVGACVAEEDAAVSCDSDIAGALEPTRVLLAQREGLDQRPFRTGVAGECHCVPTIHRKHHYRGRGQMRTD